ncbi:MAG: S41 family peptidase [Omnitrophica WOR_2 bacterium]
MKTKPLAYISAFLILVILLSGACSAGFAAGRYTNRASTSSLSQGPLSAGDQITPGTKGPGGSGSTPVDLQALFTPFWETWTIVHDEYVDQPVDDVRLMRGAIRGMLESLGDKHTSYMDPDQYRQATIPLTQEYEGIGAWVDTSTPFLTITSPMPGFAAEKAGIKAGDVVIAVDGQDMTGVDGNLVLRKILGPEGTQVKLTIRRQGVEKPFDVTVKREKISIPSVSGKQLDNRIAYIQIYQFAENTREELRKILQDLLASHPAGLIIDLRNDGGGYLKTAIEVTSEFLDEGTILQEVYGDGKQQNYVALGGGLATKIPLVILINEGSASASEIVAGAVQDYGRGKLVGVTSYGKGTVQDWSTLSNDQGAVRITIARWLTPKGRQINEVGLKPDVEVQKTPEDTQVQRDPQLNKAVELLMKGQ